MSDEKPQLSDEQLAALTMHEEMHKFFSGFYASNPAPEIKPVVIATDAVVNGPNGKTLNWPGLLMLHIDRTFPLELPPVGQHLVFEDTSNVISPADMAMYMAEIEKIKRFQNKCDRMGYRRAKADENKARRKAKKKAKMALQRLITNA